MAKKRIDSKTLEVGGNLTGDAILGDGNIIHKPTIHNNIDSEEVGKSLGETLNESANRVKWEKWMRASQEDDSRQVMETVFVALVSGLTIGLCWKFAFPWNVETVPFFVVVTTVIFNITRVTHFGLRRSMFKVVLLSVAISLLLKYTPFAQTWMDVNQFVGAAILATLGAIIGLFVGLIQTFWHPLED
jgi:hypothetical protein